MQEWSNSDLFGVALLIGMAILLLVIFTNRNKGRN